MNGIRDGASILAATGHLSLAIAVMSNARSNALARPLALLCFCLFGWNFATVANHVVGGAAFGVLDSFFTALSPAFLLDVVLGFIGATHAHRHVRALAWIGFGGLALVSLAALASPRLFAWLDEPSWAVAFAIGWAPTLAFEVVALARHLSRHSDPAEKSRTRMVLASLAIGTAFSSSDIARGMGFPTPYLGAVGTFVSAALLASLVTRHGLFARNLSARTMAYTLAMVAAFVALYLVVFRAFAGHFAAQAFAIALMILASGTVIRELAHARAEQHARAQHLTSLGRFSAQMAHDIRGPLTALMGATQVLEVLEDDASAQGRAQRREFFALVSEQARRIEAIVARYDQMARVEPQRTLVSISELVKTVARTQGLPDSALLSNDDDAQYDADRDLLESALENVVRNAVEASDGDVDGVRIETSRDRDGQSLVIAVHDRGPGMDARILSRVFEDFFTTKANGRGFGLPFVRRVLRAHGGDVVVTSQPGKGTRVELRLPASRSEPS